MRLKRAAAIAVAALLLIGGVYTGFLAHRSRHPVSLAPAGGYPVGRAVHEIADRSRTDPLAPVGGNPRVLSMTLWYPAAAASGTPSAYAPGAWAGLHSYGWAQTSFTRIHTGTYAEAPPAAGPFPLVVLLPGLGNSALQYTAIASDLASRGYLVAGVTPTYSARLTVLGGRAVGASAAGDPADLAGPRGDGLVTVWADDARYAARQLGVLLGAHADRSRVAYVGHAFGGAAALEACRGDVSCVGAADLDGTPYGTVVTTGLARPVLLLSSDHGADRSPAARVLLEASGDRASAFTIAGARHDDFTDYAAYWLAGPVRLMLPLGRPGTLAATGVYLGSFLAAAMRGTTWQAPEVAGVRAADMLSR